MTTTTMIKLPRSPWSLPSPLSLLLELRLKGKMKNSLPYGRSYRLANVQPVEIALAAVQLASSANIVI